MCEYLLHWVFFTTVCVCMLAVRVFITLGALFQDNCMYVGVFITLGTFVHGMYVLRRCEYFYIELLSSKVCLLGAESIYYIWMWTVFCTKNFLRCGSFVFGCTNCKETKHGYLMR